MTCEMILMRQLSFKKNQNNISKEARESIFLFVCISIYQTPTHA